eukprot:jgi/Tetstr1/441558/TSEL_029787.t1
MVYYVPPLDTTPSHHLTLSRTRPPASPPDQNANPRRLGSPMAPAHRTATVAPLLARSDWPTNDQPPSGEDYPDVEEDEDEVGNKSMDDDDDSSATPSS